MRRRFLFPVEDKTQSSDVKLPPVAQPGARSNKDKLGRKCGEVPKSSLSLKPCQNWSATVSLGCLLSPRYRHYDVVIGWDEDKIDTGVWSKDVRTFTRLYYARYGNGPPGNTPWRGATMEKELGTPLVLREQGVVPSTTFLTETQNIPEQKRHTPRCLWERYSSEPLEGLTVKELCDWVVDLQPRSIHDLKPLLVLCQGLLKDVLEENIKCHSSDLETAARSWALERQELVEQYVGVIESMKAELSEFATANQENESKARISKLLNRATTCTNKILSQKKAEEQRKALFASKSEAVSLKTETINMEAKMKKLQSDLDDLKAENSQLSTTNETVQKELFTVKSRLDTLDTLGLQASLGTSLRRAMSHDYAIRDSSLDGGLEYRSGVDTANVYAGNSIENSTMGDPHKWESSGDPKKNGMSPLDMESKSCGPGPSQEKWREEKCKEYKRNILEGMLNPKDKMRDLPREIQLADSKDGVIKGLNKLLQDMFEDVDGIVFIVEPDDADSNSFSLNPKRFGRDCDRLVTSIPTQEHAAQRAIHARKMVGHGGYVAIPMQGRKKLASAVIVLPATTLPISLKADYGTYPFAGGKIPSVSNLNRGTTEKSPRCNNGNQTTGMNSSRHSVSYGKPPAKGSDIAWHFPGMIESSGSGYLPLPTRESFQGVSIVNPHIDITSRIKETSLKGIIHSPQGAVGFITSTNMVLSREGRVIGRIDSAGCYYKLDGTPYKDHLVTIAKVVRDEEGIPVGYVQGDSQAVDMQGSVIGREALDGRVLENKGNVAGWVNPVDAIHASDIGAPHRTSSLLKAELQGLKFKGLVKNEGGDIVGFVTTGNVVHNSKGHPIGTMSADGKFCSVFPGTGAASTFVECGVVRAGSGLPIGYISAGGTAINCSGDQIGSEHDNGRVFDSDGGDVGWVDPGFALRSSSSLHADMSNVEVKGVLTGANQEDLGLCTADGCILHPSGELIGHFDDQGRVFGLLHDRMKGVELSISPVARGGDQSSIRRPSSGPEAQDFDELGDGNGRSGCNAISKRDGSNLGVGVTSSHGRDGSDSSPRTTINMNIAEYSGVVQDSEGKAIGLLTTEGATISLAGEVMGWFDPGTSTIAGQDDIKIKMSDVTRADNGAPVGYISDDGKVVDFGIPTSSSNSGTETCSKTKSSPRKRGIENSLGSGEGVVDWLPGAAGLFVDHFGQVQGLCGTDGVATTFEGSFVGQVQRDCAIIDDDKQNVGVFVEIAPKLSDAGIVNGYMLPDGTPLLLEQHLAALHPASGGAPANVGGTELVETFQLVSKSTVVDTDGNVIGRINKAGVPVAETGEPVVLGELIKNRAITKQGKVVGVLRPSDKSIVDDKGEVIGVLDPDGIGVSTSGAVLGKLSTETVVVNPEGGLVGQLSMSAAIVSRDERCVGEIQGACVVATSEGDLVGTIDGQCVRNLDGNDIGIHVGNEAFDLNGDQIGQVTDDKFVSFSGGGPAGRLSAGGELIDMSGVVIGRVKPDQALHNLFEFSLMAVRHSRRAVEMADKELQVNFIDGDLVSGCGFETDFDMEGGGDPGIEALTKISKQVARKMEEFGEGVNNEIFQLDKDMSHLSDRQLNFAKKLMTPSSRATFRGMVTATIFARRLRNFDDIRQRHSEELEHLQGLRNRILEQLSAKVVTKSFKELRTYRRPPTAAALVVASVMMLLGDECCEKLKLDALEGKPFPSNPHYITDIWIQMRQHMTPQLLKRMQQIDTTVDDNQVVENCAAADFVIDQVPEDQASRVSQGVALLRHWVDLMLHIFKSSQLYREYLHHSEAP